ECGHHYARSMSSWALLLALSGFHCDVAAGSISFAPATGAAEFRCFFSAGTGWGAFEQQTGETGLVVGLTLDYGRLHLRRINLQPVGPATVATASLNDIILPLRIAHANGATAIEFATLIELTGGDRLNIKLTTS
ncbi:MAG TPA: hypothetical protein VM536_10225, partial [Chloroflexia bacterium]|nr:hypothetical protein [Chloroflexia bacterium]